MSVSVLKFVFFLHGVALGRPGISEKDVKISVQFLWSLLLSEVRVLYMYNITHDTAPRWTIQAART